MTPTVEQQELRIGNLVYRKDLFNDDLRIERILELGQKATTSGPVMVICDYKDLQPIPLSEDWLLKFGVEYAYEVSCDDSDISGGTVFQLSAKTEFENIINFTEIISKNGKFYFIISMYGSEFDGSTIYEYIEIKFVHKLQNFFYEYKGSELTLKEDIKDTTEQSEFSGYR